MFLARFLKWRNTIRVWLLTLIQLIDIILYGRFAAVFTQIVPISGRDVRGTAQPVIRRLLFAKAQLRPLLCIISRVQCYWAKFSPSNFVFLALLFHLCLTLTCLPSGVGTKPCVDAVQTGSLWPPSHTSKNKNDTRQSPSWRLFRQGRLYYFTVTCIWFFEDGSHS